MKLQALHKNWRLTAMALGLQALSVGVWAQTQPTAPPQSQIQQSIEQAIQQKSNQGVRAQAPAIDVLGREAAEPIDKLLTVRVLSPELKERILGYWKDSLGKAVSPEEISRFNAWLFETTRREGYLSYSQTKVVPQAGGSELEVTVVRPMIRAIRVVFSDKASQGKYGQLLLQRFEQDFKVGKPLDTLALDQRLDTLSYDLPLELLTSVRAAGPQAIDLVVSARELKSQPGQWQGGLVQLNNYGIKSYGRPQVLGSISYEGLTPKSSLNLSAQASEGILAYGRAEYEAPFYGSEQRGRVWAAASNSHTILGGQAASNGHFKEIGVGTSNLTPGERDFVVKSEFDFAVRHSDSSLRSTGQSLSQVHDHQMRFRAAINNDRLTSNSRHVDFQLAIGHYSRLDGIRSVEMGPYARFDLNLRHRQHWDEDNRIHTLLRFKAQLNSARLDSPNQMTLGGVNGVRAYASVDGVGDRGALVSLELNRRLDNGVTVGGFYDGGVIQLLNPQAGEYARTYALQALGVQTLISHQNNTLNLSLAKGIRGYKGWTPSNIDTQPNNWRLNAALTHYF